MNTVNVGSFNINDTLFVHPDLFNALTLQAFNGDSSKVSEKRSKRTNSMVPAIVRHTQASRHDTTSAVGKTHWESQKRKTNENRPFLYGQKNIFLCISFVVLLGLLVKVVFSRFFKWRS